MGDLAGLLAAGTAAPALVLAAVVHAEIATAAPFVSHNGLVARALERLLMVTRGVDAKSLWFPRRAISRCAGNTSRTCAATARAEPRACTRGFSTPRRPTPPGAEASPLVELIPAGACERHPARWPECRR